MLHNGTRLHPIKVSLPAVEEALPRTYRPWSSRGRNTRHCAQWNRITLYVVPRLYPKAGKSSLGGRAQGGQVAASAAAMAVACAQGGRRFSGTRSSRGNGRFVYYWRSRKILQHVVREHFETLHPDDPDPDGLLILHRTTPTPLIWIALDRLVKSRRSQGI